MTVYVLRMKGTPSITSAMEETDDPSGYDWMRPRQDEAELLDVVVRSRGCSGMAVRLSSTKVILMAVVQGT